MTAYRFIDAEKAHHTVRMICRVISVSRTAYIGFHSPVEFEALHRASITEAA